MNELCPDIAYRSVNHVGEQLCGDHVETVDNENSTVIVLADGLGSGVKASILSTLTSKIISTMLSAQMNIEECVKTIAATLPVCSERQIAYSTFTILSIINNEWAQIIQFDNPLLIMLRDGKNFNYDKSQLLIDGKTIYQSKVKLQEDDLFVFTSDGAVWAGVGQNMNFGWQRDEIVDFVQSMYHTENTAATYATALLDMCVSLYGGKPGDDTTVCAVRMRKREPMNILFGPPINRDDCKKMMSLFFSKNGKHIVCGGSTAGIAAKFLKKDVVPKLDYSDPDIPPISEIEGVELVTEGVITINRVVDYAKDYVGENKMFDKWTKGKDGASMIARLIFDEATDINFYVGRAINPAHQNPDLPINFSIKMQLVKELTECLEKMGKKVMVSYF